MWLLLLLLLAIEVSVLIVYVLERCLVHIFSLFLSFLHIVLYKARTHSYQPFCAIPHFSGDHSLFYLLQLLLLLFISDILRAHSYHKNEITWLVFSSMPLSIRTSCKTIIIYYNSTRGHRLSPWTCTIASESIKPRMKVKCFVFFYLKYFQFEFGWCYEDDHLSFNIWTYFQVTYQKLI